ncbi:unnamed protein product [Cylicocyclus nassatus]|uniref:Kringle domain-containing protein n=1 Tax=Cylicocyclus nassatus TaxID=53992 RepID=A0AA36M5S2_CYLNA|nr:unnamed protein product [Cylicocyclus nassatus]
MRSVVIVALLLHPTACGEDKKKEGWIINSPEFFCDQTCRADLYKASEETNRTSCLDKDPLALDKSRQKEIGKCLREVNGLKQQTTTGLPRKDYRISCRPPKNRMQWYRGWQSLTFHGKPCIRWDEAPVRFPLESFYNVSAPSLDYMTLKIYSTTISQHENYCRNPDNHIYGPWCFYNDKNEIRRAPCFHTCITDIKKLCLAKAFFPFYQTPYMFEGIPQAPVPPRTLREVTNKELWVQNERNDLSDILDVPEVLRAIPQITPLYTIKFTTRHLTQARLAGKAVVTRKKCHQTGLRTLIAGPWTPVKDDYLSFPEDREKSVEEGDENVKAFKRINFLAGRQGINKPWVPCFAACEDNTITCWPKQTSRKLNERLFYFGNRAVNRNERVCLKWTEAMSALYNHNSEYHRKENKRHGEDKIDAELRLQVFYYQQLSKRVIVGEKMLVHRFLDGGGRLLHSAICLDLARLIEFDESKVPKGTGKVQLMLKEAHRSMFEEGPGCFSWIDKKKSYVKYIPCFHPCPCGSDAMKAPFKPYREMCEKKSHEYEPCTARRDARKLLIRRHDEEVKPLPEAEVRGLYVPLILILVTAVVCFAVSFFSEIVNLLLYRRNG